MKNCSEGIELFCPNCGKDISEESTFCPHCGKEIPKISKAVIETKDSSSVQVKKSYGKIIGTIVALIIIIAIVLFVVSMLPGFHGNLLNPTDPEITMLTGQEGFEGLNYVFKVDLNVKNNGGSGEVEVFAEIDGSGRIEEKSQTIHLEEGETKSLHFVFDITILGSLGDMSMNYKAWAYPV